MKDIVILIGAARSGTKFLRDSLSVGEDVSVIPFDIGYIWRYGNEDIPHDELTPDMLTEKIIAHIRRTVLALTDSGTRSVVSILVEKSVPNALRVAYIHKIFPEAKFIHLIRDGRAVVESSMRLWKEPPQRSYLLKKLRYFPWSNYRYAFWYVGNMISGMLSSDRGQQVWGPRYSGIADDLRHLTLATVCTRQWRRCVELSQQQFELLSDVRVCEVRYEDLMHNTSAIEELCDFVGVSDKTRIVENFRNTVRPGNQSKWRSSLSAVDLSSLEAEAGDLLRQLDYCGSSDSGE